MREVDAFDFLEPASNDRDFYSTYITDCDDNVSIS